MRILVVSDIHGNWPALEAVAAVPHDAVVCLGDIVGYGPQPAACLRWLRDNGAHIVQGNHDRALADDVAPRCRPDFEWLAAATAGIARSQLGEEELAFLRALPQKRDLVLVKQRILMLHATPADPLYSYLGPDPYRWRSAVAAVDADLLLVGHTHLPFHFRYDGLQVANPGSLGQPKDGDPRAAFALIEDGVLRLERATYPIEDTVRALQGSGLSTPAFEALASLLRTGAPQRPPAARPPEGARPARIDTG